MSQAQSTREGGRGKADVGVGGQVGDLALQPRREHESAARGSGGSMPTLPEDSPKAHLDEGLSQSAEHKQATVSSVHHEGR